MTHTVKPRIPQTGITDTERRRAGCRPISAKLYQWIALEVSASRTRVALTIAHARSWCDDFFGWYNTQHHHDSLALFTPEQVFAGHVERIAERRQEAWDAAYRTTPSASSLARLWPQDHRNA